MTEPVIQTLPEPLSGFVPDLGEAFTREASLTAERTQKGLSYYLSHDPPVALTAKDTIHQRGAHKLYHYRPQTPDIRRHRLSRWADDPTPFAAECCRQSSTSSSARSNSTVSVTRPRRPSRSRP